MLKGKLLKSATASSVANEEKSLEKDLAVIEGYRSLMSDAQYQKAIELTKFVWECRKEKK